jgi:RimJ/RimL family protein N-acetyltransferase
MSGVIKTSRLLLRMPETADAQALTEIHLDPEVLAQGLVTLTNQGFVTQTPSGGLDLALRNIERMRGQWKDFGYGQWSIVEKKTGDVIGRVGFYHREPQSDVEIGWIIRRSHWGNGFATEGTLAAIDWAWRFSQIDHIVSVIRPHDARSMRVAAKVGLRFERESIEPLDGERRFICGVHRPASQSHLSTSH